MFFDIRLVPVKPYSIHIQGVGGHLKGLEFPNEKCVHTTGGVLEQKALEALQLRASLANPGDRAALLAHPDATELPPEQIETGQVFVAEQAGSIIGFSAILPRSDGETELDALFVEPSLWRKGVGRLLVDHCPEAARARGSAALHVIGNPHAEAFYRAATLSANSAVASGFSVIGTAETRFSPGLLMRRTL